MSKHAKGVYVFGAICTAIVVLNSNHNYNAVIDCLTKSHIDDPEYYVQYTFGNTNVSTDLDIKGNLNRTYTILDVSRDLFYTKMILLDEFHMRHFVRIGMTDVGLSQTLDLLMTDDIIKFNIIDEQLCCDVIGQAIKNRAPDTEDVENIIDMFKSWIYFKSYALKDVVEIQELTDSYRAEISCYATEMVEDCNITFDNEWNAVINESALNYVSMRLFNRKLTLSAYEGDDENIGEKDGNLTLNSYNFRLDESIDYDIDYISDTENVDGEYVCYVRYEIMDTFQQKVTNGCNAVLKLKRMDSGFYISKATFIFGPCEKLQGNTDVVEKEVQNE